MRANSNLQLKLERPLIVFFYRILARWIGGRYNILLLTTTGRKSHRKRTVPVVYVPIEGGFLVTGANIGSDVHPGWFFNLKHEPKAQIQIGGQRISVLAEEVDPQERERVWEKWIGANPPYQTMQDKTARKFPIVMLKPT